MSPTDRIKEAFDAARRLSPAQRGDHLAALGRQDPSLCRQVQSLLDALDRGSGFLAEATVREPVSAANAMGDGTAAARAKDAGADSEWRFDELPGEQIGPYKLLDVIGEGGFGTVYLAEQRQPVHRHVALKVIKFGMDTRQVIARFEAERQALAMMEHPNIAKVLDAGTTATGRPYFVMELV